MPTVQFRGKDGRRLWENIRDHLWLIDAAPTMHGMSADERRVAEVRMIAFMVTAAWGYHWTSDRKYGSRLERFLYLRNINNLIYNITYGNDDLIVYVRGGGGVKCLSLGRAQGFTAVLPLTREGYDDYTGNRLSATELVEPHIVPLDQSINNTNYMMITGAVHFPSLVNDQRLDDPQTIRHSAYPVVADLLRQLGRFAPKLAIAGDTRDTVHVKGDVFRPPPTILCFISGRGSGEPLLRKAGFAPEGEDKTGNRKYILRMGGADRTGGKVSLIKRVIYYQLGN